MNKIKHILGIHDWEWGKPLIEHGRVYSILFRKIPEGGLPYMEEVQYRTCKICGKKEKRTID